MNGQCCDIDTIRSEVQAALWAEMNEGNIQAPLMDCAGNTLGRAKVPTCDTVGLWIQQALAVSRVVRHDTTLSGSGTCDNPLTVNKSWLSAFIRANNDQYGIQVSPDSGISGNGSKTNPLALDIVHDDSMDGAGTKDSPLGVDDEWLKKQIDSEIDSHGITTGGDPDSGISGNGTEGNPLKLNVQHDSSMSGAGTKDSPLKLNVQHGKSLDGDGTAANPLDVDPEWIQEQVTGGEVLAIGNGVASTQTTEDGTLPTTIVGGVDSVLGTPAGYVYIGNNLGLPVYSVNPPKVGG